MPREPNQQPVPGQKKPLPRDRVPSSIPKAGTGTAWLYPSPQMFYNGVRSPGPIRRCLAYGKIWVNLDRWQQRRRGRQRGKAQAHVVGLINSPF